MKVTTVVTKSGNPLALLPCLVFLAVLAVGSGPVHGGASPVPLGAPSSQPEVPAQPLPDIPDPDGFVAVAVGDYFSCDIPPDWSRFDNYGSGFGLSNEEKKTYGFHLRAPEPDEIPVAISIFYYAEGNLMYKSVDHYTRVFTQPALGVPLEGSSYGDVTPMKVAGRDGMVFERVKKEYVPRGNSTGRSEKTQ